MKKKYTGFLLLFGIALLVSCFVPKSQSEPKTDYASNQTVEMQQEYTPEPIVAPISEQTATLTPEPTATPTQEPTTTLITEPTTTSAPDSATTANASSVLVWIDDTAKRYHRKNGCGMDNAYQVTLEKAIEMGKTPCGRCY